MNKHPCAKERRRVIELLRLIMRCAPLSPAQRDRLERACRVLRLEGGNAKSGKRRLYVAIGDIAQILLELVAEAADQRPSGMEG